MRKKIDEFYVGELIGAGMYGEVYHGFKGEGIEQQEYAIKVIQKKKLDEKSLVFLEREITILRMLNHPNIIKLIDVRMTSNNFYLIFEYCNGGDLQKFKQNNKNVPETLVRNIISQIISGLNSLYEINGIHRDLKLSNIFLNYPDELSRKNSTPEIKIGDFGFSRFIADFTNQNNKNEILGMSIVGTPVNMAPELLHKNFYYSNESDIWSLGTMIYELLCGKVPFIGYCHDDLIRTIDMGIYRISKKLKLSCEILDFLNLCLQKTPENRGKWKTHILEHKILKNAENYTKFEYSNFESENKGKFMKNEENYFVFSTQERYNFYSTNYNLANIKENKNTSETLEILTENSETFSNGNPFENIEDDLENFAEFVKIEDEMSKNSDFIEAKTLSSLKINEEYF